MVVGEYQRLSTWCLIDALENLQQVEKTTFETRSMLDDVEHAKNYTWKKFTATIIVISW